MSYDIQTKAIFMEGIGVFSICYFGGWSVINTLQGDDIKGNITSIAIVSMFVYTVFFWISSSQVTGHFNPVISCS